MLARLRRLFKPHDYRLHGYRHTTLDTGAGRPWYERLRFSRVPSGYSHNPAQEPIAWGRYRKILYLILALVLGWLLAESILAWNFFDG
jgi:hypothetical protein